MSSPRRWVIEKLHEKFILFGKPENAFAIEHVGTHGIGVQHQDEAPSLIYCAGVDSGKIFDLEALQRARTELPEVQFIVVVPTRIAHEVYAHAPVLNVCVDGFGELVSALLHDQDISCHQDREQAYVIRRLRATKVVTSVRRRGYRAYEVERRPPLRPITIATIDHYELTSDDVYTSIEEYGHLGIDVITITNPSTQGISADALTAGRLADVKVLLFRDFLNALPSSWI